MPGTTAFPTAIDAYTDIDGSAFFMDGRPHDQEHNNAFAALIALQTKVGIDASADTTSIDYRLAQLEQMKCQRDDMTAAGGENLITLGAAVFGNSLEVFKDGTLLPLVAYTFSPPSVDLVTAATAGEVYSSKYWTFDPSPAASVLSVAGFDLDAVAFLTATSITDPTISAAINTLVLDLKACGVWSKCTLIYPFVGGSSATHAVNLKSPGTFDVTWTGTITHSATGVQGDGSTGYGMTGCNPLTDIATANDVHWAVYSRTNSANTSMEMGCWGGAAPYLGMNIRYTDNAGYAYTDSNGPGYEQIVAASNPSSDAFYTASRTSSSASAMYRNGVAGSGSLGTGAGALPNAECALLALHVSGGIIFSRSAREIAFASLGVGLSSTEAGDYYTAVQAFQTSLSRDV